VVQGLSACSAKCGCSSVRALGSARNGYISPPAVPTTFTAAAVTPEHSSLRGMKPAPHFAFALVDETDCIFVCHGSADERSRMFNDGLIDVIRAVNVAAHVHLKRIPSIGPGPPFEYPSAGIDRETFVSSTKGSEASWGADWMLAIAASA